MQASELSMGGGDEGMNHIDEEGRVSMDDDEVMAEAGTGHGWSGEGDTVKCKPVHQEQQQCLICMVWKFLNFAQVSEVLFPIG